MTRFLNLRSEQPPDDAAVVLRAGVTSPDNIRRSAERTFAIYAVYDISVEGVIGRTVLVAKKTRRRFHIDFVEYFRLRNGKIAYVRVFGDTAMANAVFKES